jgi:hypothetical protein
VLAIVVGLVLALAGLVFLDETARPTGKRMAREPIPKSVKDDVWRRDQGRCQWREDEEICGSRANLEFDHVKPVSRGGTNTYRNLELLCQRHNRQKAAKYNEPLEIPCLLTSPSMSLRHLGRQFETAASLRPQP